MISESPSNTAKQADKMVKGRLVDGKVKNNSGRMQL